MSEHVPAAVWDRFSIQRSAGDVVEAVVVKALPFGALVEIDGVTGLATPASRAFTPGAQVRLRVATIDAAQRRFAAETA